MAGVRHVWACCSSFAATGLLLPISQGNQLRFKPGRLRHSHCRLSNSDKYGSVLAPPAPSSRGGHVLVLLNQKPAAEERTSGFDQRMNSSAPQLARDIGRREAGALKMV